MDEIEGMELDWSAVQAGPALYERIASGWAALKEAWLAFVHSLWGIVRDIGSAFLGGLRRVVRTPKSTRIYLRTHVNDLVLNGLTVVAGASAVAALGFLVAAGSAAYGLHLTLAGLLVWYALLAAATTYVSYRVLMWLSVRLSLSEQPNLHANDLIS
jgi:hypothetical protein